MIYFNVETRQFTSNNSKIDWKKVGDTVSKGVNSIGGSVTRLGRRAQITGRKTLAHAKNLTPSQTAFITGGGNLLYNKIKREKLYKQYIDQGKSDKEARKLAKRQTQGTIASAASGALVGGGVKAVGDKLGLTTPNGRDKLILARGNMASARLKQADNAAARRAAQINANASKIANS